ncbi:MAG TPA: hypothetical protein VGA47_12115 [Candidatus Dormibacteraeota bacterium]
MLLLYTPEVTDLAPSTLPVRLCASDYCPPSIPGPLTDWPWSPTSRYFKMTTTEVQLTRQDSAAVWIVAVRSTLPPDLVGRGDFTGDDVPDYVFQEVQPTAKRCAGHTMSQTQLVFVDGATGSAWRPIAPLDDICWTNYGYATHQWGVGSAYIGDFLPGGAGGEVVLFPYYATDGWVLTFDSRIGWRRLQETLTYPSSPRFDRDYNAANSRPCKNVPDAPHCYHRYSHVPNAIFLGANGAAPLLVLTSNRAVIYRSDFTPTGDYVWGYPEGGGGRDYGLVESHDVANGKMVTLIGGCSVAKTHDTMLTGKLSDDNCGLFHHYEYFLVRGQSIVRHAGRFYGWYGTVGRWQERLEFPFPSSIRLTGGSLWSVFNLYKNGQWRTQLLPDPARPDRIIEIPGWYVWGSVTDRFGRVLLIATRTAATPSISTRSYIPPWGFDFVQWSGGKLVSISHHSGVTPSLALYPPGPDYHVSDGDTFGLIQRYSPPIGFSSLLVESRDGTQAYVSVP